ncbi:MAG: hypothetical protein NC517_05885 [Firmicutes bacterium]|nr:hypothetical protein [Bacillota bacterium]
MEHLILKTKEKYSVLHSTYEGLHYSEKLKKYLEEELIETKEITKEITGEVKNL